jgi:hypothetical protein
MSYLTVQYIQPDKPAQYCYLRSEAHLTLATKLLLVDGAVLALCPQHQQVLVSLLTMNRNGNKETWARKPKRRKGAAPLKSRKVAKGQNH